MQKNGSYGHFSGGDGGGMSLLVVSSGPLEHLLVELLVEGRGRGAAATFRAGRLRAVELLLQLLHATLRVSQVRGQLGSKVG